MSKIIEKIILISGGSDGLGLATAKSLSRDHTVIILATSREKCESAVKYHNVDDYVLADLTKEKDVEKAVKSVIKKYGHIDVLINNAGVWIEGPLEENDPEKIKKVMEVNSLGTIFLTQQVLPYMKKLRSGRIINVVSQAGLIPKAERSVYRASKYAVRGFTESLIPEVAPYNISICGFYPDKMNTNFFKKAGEKIKTNDFIDVSESVRCLEFMVNTSPDLNIPILGLKKLSYY